MKVCIVGTGAYGSYVAKSLLENYPSVDIVMIEAGTSIIKSANEIGYGSEVFGKNYSGPSRGRYFGLGGTTTKWGGQLLFYSKKDFQEPDLFLSQVIELNETFKNKVLSRFGLRDNRSEQFRGFGFLEKPGIWLSFFKRNLFRTFKLNMYSNIHLFQGCRVSKLLVSDGKVEKLIYIQEGKEKDIVADYYFITPGAFETARLSLMSDLFSQSEISFSDHISKKFVRFSAGTVVGAVDFKFRFKGFSLRTTRIIGEVDNNSFYLHPVYNTNFPFFQAVKKLLFRGHISFRDFINLINDIPRLLVFIYAIIIKREIHVFNNEWYLYLDIDNPTRSSSLKLSENKDNWGLPGIEVEYEIDPRTISIIEEVKSRIDDFLDDKNLDYQILDDSLTLDNLEDIYHPYGMFHFDSLEDYYSRWPNMLMINTGILPRCGGINPTAALFPIIEDFIRNRFYVKVKSIG